VFGLLMRRCYMAAGHNALRRSGLGQKHAVNLLHWLKWGVLIFGSTGSVHYPSVALSNLVSASCSRAGLKLPVIRALGKMSRAPSSPATIRKFGGHHIARGAEADVLEGEDNSFRNGIIQFAAADDARAWFDSPDYQEVRKLRENCSTAHFYTRAGA
jgi:uncharacterized protein (DUF1330 family)